MKIGLLFYDDDPKAQIEEKVRRAAARYQEKYGHAATACYVHPSMLSAGDCVMSGVEVYGQRSVLPNHLWLGVGESRAEAPRAEAVPVAGHTKKSQTRKTAAATAA
jgi:hypothetical protein